MLHRKTGSKKRVDSRAMPGGRGIVCVCFVMLSFVGAHPVGVPVEGSAIREKSVAAIPPPTALEARW